MNRRADVTVRRKAKDKAASPLSDLAQHGGEHHGHPDRLLAVISTLQADRTTNQRPRRRHPSSQLANPLGINPGDGRRPTGCLRFAVRLSGQVVLKALKTYRVALQKRLIAQMFHHQRVGERQHDCHVRAWPRCHPLGVECGQRIVTQGSDVDERDSGPRAIVKQAPHAMPTDTARTNPGVFGPHSAEHDDQLAVISHIGHGRLAIHQFAKAAHHMGRDVEAGTEAVGSNATRIATKTIHETMKLSQRVVKPARAGPTVGTRKDCLVAV